MFRRIGAMQLGEFVGSVEVPSLHWDRTIQLNLEPHDRPLSSKSAASEKVAQNIECVYGIVVCFPTGAGGSLVVFRHSPERKRAGPRVCRTFIL
jgi:hypothetical protein